MSQDEDNWWRSTKYREGITCKLEEALRESGRMPFITSNYIENLIFEDAANKDEYLNYVAKWILQLRAPPRIVTSDQNSYLPSILLLALPQRNMPVEEIVQVQQRIAQAAVRDGVPYPFVQEFSSQPTKSDIESEEPCSEKFTSNFEHPPDFHRVRKRIRRRQKKNWSSNQYRQNMISKLSAAMERSGVERNITSVDIESLIFNKATTKDEYLDNVAKWILRIGDK